MKQNTPDTAPADAGTDRNSAPTLARGQGVLRCFRGSDTGLAQAQIGSQRATGDCNVPALHALVKALENTAQAAHLRSAAVDR